MTYLSRTIDFADPLTASIFDELPLWGSPFGQLLLDEVPLERNMRVLDVGCGTGFPLFELAHRLGPTAHVTGIDIWEAALERAKQKRDFYEATNVTLVQGDATSMQFEEATFDLVVSNLGINNFDQPLGVCRQCLRVLRPGGKLLLTTNLTGHMKEFYRVFREVLGDLELNDALNGVIEQEAHRGTVDSVKTLLTEAGFTLGKVLEREATWRYLDAQAFFQHPLTVFGFLAGWRAPLEGQDEQLIFKHLEAALNHLAAQKGELRMTIPMLLVEALKPT